MWETVLSLPVSLSLPVFLTARTSGDPGSLWVFAHFSNHQMAVWRPFGRSSEPGNALCKWPRKSPIRARSFKFQPFWPRRETALSVSAALGGCPTMEALGQPPEGGGWDGGPSPQSVVLTPTHRYHSLRLLQLYVSGNQVVKPLQIYLLFL